MDEAMKLRNKGWTIAIVLLLCATSAFAQDQKQGAGPNDANPPIQPQGTSPNGGNANPPIGAAHGVGEQDNSQSYDPSQVTPDRNTLAGATAFTLGSLQHNHNLFDPSISFSQLGQVVPASPGQSSLTGITMVGGSLNFNHNWSAYHLSTTYNGGETFNEGYGPAFTFFNSFPQHYQLHNGTVAQEADCNRWRIVLQDTFAASPGAT